MIISIIDLRYQKSILDLAAGIPPPAVHKINFSTQKNQTDHLNELSNITHFGI
jgi:hypothetical protein